MWHLPGASLDFNVFVADELYMICDNHLEQWRAPLCTGCNQDSAVQKNLLIVELSRKERNRETEYWTLNHLRPLTPFAPTLWLHMKNLLQLCISQPAAELHVFQAETVTQHLVQFPLWSHVRTNAQLHFFLYLKIHCLCSAALRWLKLGEGRHFSSVYTSYCHTHTRGCKLSPICFPCLVFEPLSV